MALCKQTHFACILNSLITLLSRVKICYLNYASVDYNKVHIYYQAVLCCANVLLQWMTIKNALFLHCFQPWLKSTHGLCIFYAILTTIMVIFFSDLIVD